MKTYTIERRGIVHVPSFGEHYCGFGNVHDFPYIVRMTVRGKLAGPQFFVVDNMEIDRVVQETFASQVSVSCERMADMMVDALLDYMRAQYADWHVISLHCETTGAPGMAMLSCDYTDAPKVEYRKNVAAINAREAQRRKERYAELDSEVERIYRERANKGK